MLTANSGTLLFQINSSGLIYKKNENGIFESLLKLSVTNYSYDNTYQIYDTTSVLINLPYDSINTLIKGSININTCQCVNYLKIIITDLNKNQDYLYGMTIDARFSGSSPYYNITDNFGEDLMSTVVTENSTVNIIPPADISNLFVRYYFREYPMALPPFSDNPPLVFDFHSDSSRQVSATELEGITFTKEGLYLFQTDTMFKTGFTVLCADEDFPSFTTADKLIDALRYLTTRQEYEKLISSTNKKKSVDGFWLEKAGNNERGRQLIRVYYGRAKDANILFTSYMPGWKTDRGMIYMIFGPPTSVYFSGSYEFWDYRSIEGLPSIRLTFRKLQNPFTDQDYALERGPELQNIWYLAVDNWRAGRIVGDY
jgi:GWxTD domain-containing protein